MACHGSCSKQYAPRQATPSLRFNIRHRYAHCVNESQMHPTDTNRRLSPVGRAFGFPGAIAASLFVAALLWFGSPLLLVSSLRNNQIEWTGNIAGLWPSPGIVPRLVLLRGNACRPHLVRALADPSRFAAAHVCLSFLDDGRSTGGSHFNGLAVDLWADGRTVIPPSQKTTLIARWSPK